MSRVLLGSVLLGCVLVEYCRCDGFMDAQEGGSCCFTQKDKRERMYAKLK